MYIQARTAVAQGQFDQRTTGDKGPREVICQLTDSRTLQYELALYR